jgi:branched-chain amino acid transport system ATP-binding protein
LLGTNGNGKSSLMKCVMGLLRPSAGRIVAQIDDESVNLVALATEEIVARGVILVPEGRHLLPKLTVEENLYLGALRQQARPHIRRNLEASYDLFPRLAERRRQPAGSMSGGEQQMVALARALMAEPKILLVDEPSVGLAPIVVRAVIDAIAQLKARLGLTVLMAEQNFQQALRVADRGYVIVHGSIAFEGRSPQELRENDLVRKLYLGQ